MPDSASDILAVAVLVAVLGCIWFVWYFRKEVRDLFPRLRKFGAKAPKVEFSGEFDGHNESTADLAVESASADNSGDDDPIQQAETSTGDSADDAPTDLAKQRDEAFTDKNFPRALELQKQIAAGLDDETQTKREWVLFHLRCFIRGIGTNPLEKLKELANDAEVAQIASRAIGIALDDAEDYVGAAEYFDKAIELSESDDESIAFNCNFAAKAWASAGRLDLAQARIRQSLMHAAEDESAEAAAWRALAAVYAEFDMLEDRAFALENAAALDPSNASVRFDLGYAYGDSGNDDFAAAALFHYERSIKYDPEMQSAINNAGVQAARFSLKGTSVNHYLNAQSKGNSLAAANAAYLLIGAGFFEHAERLLLEAEQSEDVHENVLSARAELETRRSEEQTKLKNKLDDGRSMSVFLRKYKKMQMLNESSEKIGRLEMAAEGIAVDTSQHGDSLELLWSEGARKFRIKGVLDGRTFKGQKQRMGVAMYDKSKETGWERLSTVYGLVSAGSFDSIEVSMDSLNSVSYSRLARVRPAPSADVRN